MRKLGITIVTAMLLSLTTLTAVAQENLSPQGCRRGTPRQQSIHLSRGTSVDMTVGGDFYRGERHQLTVLVAFNDCSFVGDEAATLEQWDKIFNTENLTEEPFKGSVHDYFIDQSYGDFSIVFDLVYVQVSGDIKKYASSYTDDENSQYLVQDIADILKTRDIDWGKYDWNGDGFINQLLIVYAGHGRHQFLDSELIWPHQWRMSIHEKDLQQDVYCEPIPVSSGGKDYMIDSYCALNELGKNDEYDTFGIICHEYSHCFGLPDFYGSSYVVGGWDLMDNGFSNGQGYRPCNYSAHERMLMGWLTPVELTGTTTVTDMPALADEPVAYLIRNDGADNEYYIVENRQQKGWDEDLPGSGIIVFHVDFDKDLWINSLVNIEDTKHYYIFPANNKSSYLTLSGWAYPYVTTDSHGKESVVNDCLTNTSKPAAVLNNRNTDGKLLMSKPITRMAVDANGLASFVFMEDTDSQTDMTAPGTLHTRTGDATQEGWYRLDGTRLSGQPTCKGIYVRPASGRSQGKDNGRKVVVF